MTTEANKDKPPQRKPSKQTRENVKVVEARDAKLTPVVSPRQGASHGTDADSYLEYVIKHQLPGRLRVHFPELHFDSRLGQSIIDQLSAVNGVSGVRTNLWNASVVVTYDDAKLAHEDLIHALNLLKPPTGQVPAGVASKTLNWRSKIEHVLNVIDSLFPPVAQLAFGAGAFVASFLGLPTLISRLLLGAAVVPITSRALRTMVDERRLGVDALDGMAATLMMANGQLIEAGFMTGLIALGEFIRERTAKRCEKMVSDLLGLAGRSAWLVKGKKRICVPADEVKPGDTVVVYPGDMVPVDGEIIDGEAAIDQSKLTGEAIPVEVKTGDVVYASTVLVEGKIYVRCQAVGSETKAGMVLECISTAPLSDTRIQNYASVLADKLVVPIFVSAGICFALTKNVTRLMSMLIFDFSTGIRIAAPTAVLSSMHRAGRRGILIKSGAALEKLATIDAIVFDKTGTLTSGEPKVTHVVPFGAHTREDILAVAAAVEQRLHHPAARAIVKLAVTEGIKIPDRAESTHLRGMGVKAQIDNHDVLVGSKRMIESEGISTEVAADKEARAIKEASSLAYIAIDGKLAGLISYQDHIRPDVAKTINRLKKMGVKKLVMATGDGEVAARHVANICGITEVLSKAFPEQKADLVRTLKAAGHRVAVIGDGINDSPALAHADVAISLNGGTEAARHSANVILTDDDLSRLPEAIKIARDSMDLVRQNLSLAVVPNGAGLGLAAFGLVGPAAATMLNNGSAICAALNSLRPLYASDKPLPGK